MPKKKKKSYEINGFLLKTTHVISIMDHDSTAKPVSDAYNRIFKELMFRNAVNIMSLKAVEPVTDNMSGNKQI